LSGSTTRANVARLKLRVSSAEAVVFSRQAEPPSVLIHSLNTRLFPISLTPHQKVFGALFSEASLYLVLILF
jgi:hypothetical protein